MSSLKHKPTDKSSPQGNPRVYFCCHPDDFDRYFDEISADILKKHKCAFYYADSETVRDDDFFSDLGQVQLFVVAVTDGFLMYQNDALSRDFPFAVSHHIPVLPIMLQPSLADHFNRLCGDLQFLDKYTIDDTALSYEEKLEKFLDTVIVGDKLAQKIRDNFDAYIFLSYRKKDRRLARKLMQLIHKNDFCQRFAIWYDEFLVPGDNFNDSIKTALSSSDLFVMAVTPNLVNETNYIMQHEFPMAKQAGKPIFPAEVAATNKLSLAVKYRGIPTCTSTENEAKFASSLKNAVSQLDVTPKADTSESRYLLGLAYLNGIDVEVDHEKAVQLITSAAQENHIAAIAKLADMYTNGIGVKRSYQTALHWLDMLTDLYRSRYADEKNSTVLSALCAALLRQADLYFRMRITDKAIAGYAQCMEIMEPHIKQYSPSLFRQAVQCCDKLGDLYVSKKQYSKAYDCFKKGFDLSYQTVNNDFSPEAVQKSYSFSKKVGDTLYKNNKTKEAEEHYLNLLARLESNTGFVDLAENKATVHLGLAELYAGTQQFSQAISSCKKALELIKPLYEQNPSAHNRMLVSLCYFHAGNACRKQKNFDKSVQCYKLYCQCYTELVKDKKSSSYHNSMRNLYIGYGLLGNVLLEAGDADSAYSYHIKAFDTEKALVLDSGNDITVAKFADRIATAAKSYKDKNLLAEARLLYLEAEKHFETVKDKLTDDKHLSLYATIELALGDIHHSSGMYPAAKKNYKKYAETYSAYSRSTKNPAAFFNTALGYKRLGEIYAAENDAQKAKNCYNDAAQWLENIPEDEMTSRYKDQLAKIREALGDICRKEHLYQDADMHYQKNISLRQQLYDTDPNDFNKGSLALAFYKAALTGCSNGKEYLLKSEEMFAELHNANPADPKRRRNLDLVQNKIKSLYG